MIIMSTYDELRAELKEKLKACEELARMMLNPNTEGHDDMEEGYDMKVYQAVRGALEEV